MISTANIMRVPSIEKAVELQRQAPPGHRGIRAWRKEKFNTVFHVYDRDSPNIRDTLDAVCNGGGLQYEVEEIELTEEQFKAQHAISECSTSSGGRYRGDVLLFCTLNSAAEHANNHGHRFVAAVQYVKRINERHIAKFELTTGKRLNPVTFSTVTGQPGGYRITFAYASFEDATSFCKFVRTLSPPERLWFERVQPGSIVRPFFDLDRYAKDWPASEEGEDALANRLLCEVKVAISRCAFRTLNIALEENNFSVTKSHRHGKKISFHIVICGIGHFITIDIAHDFATEVSSELEGDAFLKGAIDFNVYAAGGQNFRFLGNAKADTPHRVGAKHTGCEHYEDDAFLITPVGADAEKQLPWPRAFCHDDDRGESGAKRKRGPNQSGTAIIASKRQGHNTTPKDTGHVNEIQRWLACAPPSSDLFRYANATVKKVTRTPEFSDSVTVIFVESEFCFRKGARHAGGNNQAALRIYRDGRIVQACFDGACRDKPEHTLKGVITPAEILSVFWEDQSTTTDHLIPDYVEDEGQGGGMPAIFCEFLKRLNAAG